MELNFQCECGQVQGVLRDARHETVNRVVCHCRWCVDYVELLGKRDRAMDARGGVRVMQVAPANFRVVEGLEHVVCGRLSKKGAMRWYASCCDTPMANTLENPRMFFVAMSEMLLALDDAEMDRQLGPVRARVNGSFSADLARQLRARRRDLVAMVARYSGMMAVWRARGLHRPNVFFNDETSAPIVSPHRLERPATERAE